METLQADTTSMTLAGKDFSMDDISGIVSDEAAQVLTYVLAANYGGYAPSADEVDEWQIRPGRIPGKRGKLISAAVPGTGGTLQNYLAPALANMGQTVAQSFAASGAYAQLVESLGTSDALRNLVGTPGKAAVYAAPDPPESIIAWLTRLSWITVDSQGGLRVTHLGRALMKARRPSGADESVAVVMLDSENGIAYAELIGYIHELGEAIIVDPYLKGPELTTLLGFTEAKRFLVGPNLKKAEVTTMKVVIESGAAKPGCELRRAAPGVLHDRFLVGEHSIKTLGTSIHGVGEKSMTFLTEIPATLQDNLRAKVEQWWDEAEKLAERKVEPEISEN